MATLTTNGMPKEYTETLAKLAYTLEDRLYGEIKIIYQRGLDAFCGAVTHRGVIFYFTVSEVAEQIINGVGAKEMAEIVIADYRKFIPTRFIKSTKGER